MTQSVRLQSLAKVNLDLRVLRKRADGFHELRTVFQTISLADTLEIDYEPARATRLEITELYNDDALAIPDNLILRAARAVLEAMRVRARVRFRLKKRIPMGAGLGGGSSNAAAVLLALPVLAGRKVSLDELWQLGTELGSDVPFFLTGGTAVALGRGTEMYSLPEITQEPVLVIASGIHVATGPAYQALARPAGDGEGLTSSDLSRKINNFQLFVRTLGELRSAKAASASSANDFESAVFKQHPRLKAMWGRLRKQSAGARMTGSGSALFAVFGSALERDAARKILEEDRVSRGATVLAANLVNGRAYRRLWQRQLAQHLVPSRLAAESDPFVTESDPVVTKSELIWPPRSRYAR